MPAAVSGEKRHPNPVHPSQLDRVRRRTERRSHTNLADTFHAFNVVQAAATDNADSCLCLQKSCRHSHRRFRIVSPVRRPVRCRFGKIRQKSVDMNKQSGGRPFRALLIVKCDPSDLRLFPEPSQLSFGKVAYRV